MSKNLFTPTLSHSKINFWITSTYPGVCVGCLTKVRLVAVNKTDVFQLLWWWWLVRQLRLRWATELSWVVFGAPEMQHHGTEASMKLGCSGPLMIVSKEEKGCQRNRWRPKNQAHWVDFRAILPFDSIGSREWPGNSYAMYCLFPLTQTPQEKIRLALLKKSFQNVLKEIPERKKEISVPTAAQQREQDLYIGARERNLSFLKGHSLCGCGRPRCGRDKQTCFVKLHNVMKKWISCKHFKMGRLSIKYGFLASLEKSENLSKLVGSEKLIPHFYGADAAFLHHSRLIHLHHLSGPWRDLTWWPLL